MNLRIMNKIFSRVVQSINMRLSGLRIDMLILTIRLTNKVVNAESFLKVEQQ